MQEVEKRTTLYNFSTQLGHGLSVKSPIKLLGTEANHTVIDPVLSHAVKTTVEHLAAKQSGGALSFSFRIRIVGTGLSALSTLCA